jgi:hypothetical protein
MDEMMLGRPAEIIGEPLAFLPLEPIDSGTTVAKWQDRQFSASTRRHEGRYLSRRMC